MKTWDAIVVGAGPAGCAAAYDLASAGREVLLLDRAVFPRQKACAGGLTLKTVHALRYSIEPVVRQKISHMRLERTGDRSTVLRRRSPYCYMTVRQELDDYCLRQTVAKGAEFLQIRAVEASSEDHSGVTLRVDGDELRARFVVGADGVHSRIRHLSDGGNSWFWRAFALEAAVPVANASGQELVFDFAPVRDGYGWIFPKGDHVNVGLYSYATDEKIDRSRLSAYIDARLGASAQEMIGQYAGFGAARHTIAPTRTFLVGDAGGFVDPLTGEGIYFAVVSGQAAAEAIVADLEGQAVAHEHFAQATAKVRADLAVATSGARWFYTNLDYAYRFLAVRLLHPVILNAFANGFNPAKLAIRVKKLALKI